MASRGGDGAPESSLRDGELGQQQGAAGAEHPSHLAHSRQLPLMRTTTALVAQHGLHAVTMSRIAEEAGIGRATLYKYFKDVEAILFAWHDRQVVSNGSPRSASGPTSRARGSQPCSRPTPS